MYILSCMQRDGEETRQFWTSVLRFCIDDKLDRIFNNRTTLENLWSVPVSDHVRAIIVSKCIYFPTNRSRSTYVMFPSRLNKFRKSWQGAKNRFYWIDLIGRKNQFQASRLRTKQNRDDNSDWYVRHRAFPRQIDDLRAEIPRMRSILI